MIGTVGSVYRVNLWQEGRTFPLSSEEKGSRKDLLNLTEYCFNVAFELEGLCLDASGMAGIKQ